MAEAYKLVTTAAKTLAKHVSNDFEKVSNGMSL